MTDQNLEAAKSGGAHATGESICRAELRTLASEVTAKARSLGAVIVGAEKTINDARGAILAAVKQVTDQDISDTLQRTPIGQLKASGARTAALEAAGVRTALDVLRWGEAALLSIKGVGPTTTRAVLESALMLEREVRSRVRIIPNPDRLRPGDTQLLQAVAGYDEARRRWEQPARQARQILTTAQTALDQGRAATSWLQLVFTNRKRRAELAAHLLVARHQLDQPQAQQVVALGPATSAFLEIPTHELIRRFSSNTAAFVAALEQATRGGTAGQAVQEFAERPQDHRGGLPGYIAATVEAFPLQSGPLTATLRRYQEFGARYLVVQKRTLLGDDMGLGKTVQVIAAMCHRHASGDRHFFVVAPNSVLYNWHREVERHSKLKPFMLHGPDRNHILQQWRLHGGVGITTYGTVGALIDNIGPVDVLAVDEAHYAKNPAARRTQAVRMLTSHASYVTLMTGTALENRLEELHSLVTLAQPSIHPAVSSMLDVVLPDPAKIRIALSPVYLRRTQEDVLTELPECTEVDEWLELGSADRGVYRSAPRNVMNKRRAATIGSGATSAKAERLRELLDAYLSEGRKVVVFSYFRDVLDLVTSIAGGAEQLTGDVSPTARQRIIDSFGSKPGAGVLACQVEAGGIGVNLQAAQVVILMEPQFKPSTEQQAIARVRRMGQSRHVNVHRLLACSTIDEHLVRLIERKAKLFINYAHESEVKHGSWMARDASTVSIEQELQALLATEDDMGILPK